MEYYNAWREELNKNEKLRDELQQEKERNKELIKIIKNVRQMHDTKCKIIDMMAEDIAKDDPIIVKLSNESKEAKEYYFKKARGE